MGKVSDLTLLLTKPGRANMLHFLKKTTILFILILFAGGVRAASTEEDPIASEIRAARSLHAVYEVGNGEYTKRQQTWASLKDGRDDVAKKRSVEALRTLHGLIASRCCELTGLTPEWGTDELRIRKGFFDEMSVAYDLFRTRVCDLSSALSRAGTLKAEAGEVYGKVMAWAGQRATFYASCFDLYKADGSSFKASGTGHAVAEYSKGYVPGSWLGEYFHPTNMHLMLLSVSKEEVEEATSLAALMQKFHGPLGISSLNYGPCAVSTIASKRTALEGNLPIHKVREYLGDESFWKGTIPAELKKQEEE